MLKFSGGELVTDAGQAFLTGVPESVTLATGTTDSEAFLHFVAEKPAARLVQEIGFLTKVERFTVCHRYEPFWMTAKSGTHLNQVPPETQYLLVKRRDGLYVLVVPLIDGAFRCSLEGRVGDVLLLVAESGDTATITAAVTGLYIGFGEEPFALLEQGAASIMRHIGTGRLRKEKPVPSFVRKFGWCTWDAFYQEVSQEKMRAGLESFCKGGVLPRYLILDDGWQSVRPFLTGEKRLTAFTANEKFPGDLKTTVDMAKQEFGIETFLVWHAIGGYWGGVDGDALSGYDIRSQGRNYSPGINHFVPSLINWFGTACGVVPPEQIYRFYQDYHRHLRQQGVDGIKVDNQSSLEGVAQGMGGRVALMRAYHESLEGSVHTHFQGNLINCMSCANEMLFSALNSNLTRTSTDFWPNKPESHGVHLYVNAQVSAFFGEFIYPDWDMFQSGHEMGAYHAAGRAVGGCPVYVSDKPDAHNFDLLRKLVLPDGTVPVADYPGRPTADCLFYDPTKEDVLLKIWNRQGAAGLVGVFHARYGEGVGPISGSVRPMDIPAFHPSRPASYIVYAHYADELRVLNADDSWDITLTPLTAEVFTILPQNDFVPIGLVGMFNPYATVRDVTWFFEKDLVRITLAAQGRFIAWCRQRPAEVLLDGDNPTEAVHTYNAETHRLEVTVPPGQSANVIFIHFSSESAE